MISLQAFNEDEVRLRVQNLTDEKLIEYGKAGKWNCPYPDRDDGDRQVRNNMAFQLRLCREEWRRRYPRPVDMA
jgi:hypothetical protein